MMKTTLCLLAFLCLSACSRLVVAEPAWPPRPPSLAAPLSVARPSPAPPSPPASRPVCFSRQEIAAILRAKERLARWPRLCEEKIRGERAKQEILCRRERDERDILLRDCQAKKQPVCSTLCWIGIGSGVLVGIGIGVGVTILVERTRK